jgi:hypothetical protein
VNAMARSGMAPSLVAAEKCDRDVGQKPMGREVKGKRVSAGASLLPHTGT